MTFFARSRIRNAFDGGRDDIDFNRERFGTFIGADIDGFIKRAAFDKYFHIDSNLTVGARRDNPGQRRQLHRGATARRMDAQDGDVAGCIIGKIKDEVRFICTSDYVRCLYLGIPNEICVRQ